jgi:lysozyme family protein
MKENFDKAFKLVIGFEGKMSNDPHDPGGFTIWGLCKRSHPEVNEHTTLEYAKEVYKKEYWDKIGGDTLLSPIDIAAFDCAVNMGVGAAKEILVKTKDLNMFMRLRLRQYSQIVKKNPNSLRYLRGWMNRVLNLWDEL